MNNIYPLKPWDMEIIMADSPCLTARLISVCVKPKVWCDNLMEPKKKEAISQQQ